MWPRFASAANGIPKAAALTVRQGGVDKVRLQHVYILVEAALEAGTCFYCGGRLTLPKLAVDHAVPVARGGQFTIGNLRVCCQSCNWRKGKLTADEFSDLSAFVTGRFPPDVVSDIWRRLVVGGKWSPQ